MMDNIVLIVVALAMVVGNAITWWRWGQVKAREVRVLRLDWAAARRARDKALMEKLDAETKLAEATARVGQLVERNRLLLDLLPDNARRELTGR
ncbi:hypothetical protein ACWEN6_13770 [Sphaerisporangium sp. NPDC004334]